MIREREFGRLYAEHAPSLYSFLSYRTGDAVLAEDLLADSFERALRSRRSFDPRKGSERTWLFAIAVNVIRDRARRARAESRALARVGAAGDIAEYPEGLDARGSLRDALEQLSDAEREAVSLRYGADLTLADIGIVTGQPRTTVEARVYSGLRRLRDILGEDF